MKLGPYELNSIVTGDARELAKALPDNSIHCICCSPPYWGLRDYGVTDQIGLEETPEQYIQTMVELFRELRRALREDGTCWVVLGDSYSQGGGAQVLQTKNASHGLEGIRGKTPNMNSKQLLGIPWRVALALQADGWWLRSDIVWCLSGGTKVYAKTQKGVMPMTIKDMVRLDPATVQLWNGEKWTQALGWSESPRPDSPIEIELRSGERIGCTLGHEWPTQRGLIRAEDLRVGDIIQSCKLPDGGGHPRFIPDDIGWLIGLYLAEGSKGKDNTVIQIASHQKETDRFRRLQAIAKDYGATCRMHKTNGKAATINIYSKVIIGIIATYISGKTAKDKHLGVACWQRSDAFLWEVLSGYLDGDAHYDKKNDRWRIGFTRNYNLEQDLRTLCARLGVQLRLKLSEATNQDNKFKSFRGEIRFNPSIHFNAKQDGEIVRIGKSKARKFWDIGVEDTPHLFALASGILTHNSKPNPMPESVTDRPTKAHEYIFLLTKSTRYWYDAEAVKEKVNELTRRAATFRNGGDYTNGNSFYNSSKKEKNSHGDKDMEFGRNRRTVWEVPTVPFPGSHFAVFPPKLIEPCILAGCPSKVCAECGAPWERVVEKSSLVPWSERAKQGARRNDLVVGSNAQHGIQTSHTLGNQSKTTGHRPTCQCNAGTTKGVTLDPFIGSGTTAYVAIETGRDWLGFDLNEKYVQMAYERIAKARVPIPGLEPGGDNGRQPQQAALFDVTEGA